MVPSRARWILKKLGIIWNYSWNTTMSSLTPSERTKLWREKHPNAVAEWKIANRDKHINHVKKYNHKNKDKMRIYNRLWSRKKAKLPEPTRECPEVCELCGNPPGKQSLALDHCHKTGIFRGWLCGKCNRGLGLLGDNLESLQKAIIYLNRREWEYGEATNCTNGG